MTNFLLSNTNMCCWSQRDGSFEYPKYVLKLMDKKIFAILQ